MTNSSTKLPNDYQKYLEDKHSRFKTPEYLINNLVNEATGLFPKTVERLVAGEVNEVYAVKTEDGKDVIVRISHRENPDFLQEHWAIEQCKKIGIPVPSDLLIKSIKVDNQELSFCIQEKLPGDTLERGSIDYQSMSRYELKRIIVQAGKILSRIHSIPTHNWGWIDAKGYGKFKAYEEMIMEKVRQKDGLSELIHEVHFDPRFMDEIITVLNDYLYLYKGIQPKLNHGDFGPKHLMIEDDQITGILDFGGICSDSPVYDFAWWDYWNGESISLEWLKEGYEDKKLFNDQFYDMLHYMRLYRGIGLLDWYFNEGFQRAIDRAKQKLLEDLDYFKKR